MKVCKFMIEVSRDGSQSSILDDIPCCYLYNQSKEDYLNKCQEEHEKLGLYTKRAFGNKGVVAWNCVQGVDYFVRRHKEDVDSATKICLDVLMIVESKELTKAIVTTYEDIKNMLKKSNMNIDFFEKKVDIYLVEKKDILENFYYVKALFFEKKWSVEDKVRAKTCFGLFFVFVFLILICIIVDKSIETDLSGLTMAFIGLIVAVPITYGLEIFFLKRNRTESIVVNDFDQEWFSQDSAAESTVRAAASGGPVYHGPAVPESNGGVK